MKSESISVLLVEDNPADARLLREVVRDVEGNQIRLTHVETLGAALSRLATQRFDVVMLDLSLPDAEGLQTLVRTHVYAPAVPIVVLTGLDDEELAIRAVREGAQDYLVKGQVTGHLLVRAMRYATERKRAVEALQRSEEYFRSLIENALDIITVIDANGSVRYGSPSFERALGYQQGILTGSDVFGLLHPDDLDLFQEMLSVGTRHPGTAQHFECRMRHRSGTWRVLECIGKHFEAQSAVDGYVLNSRDITERKRADEQVRQLNETLRAVIEASPLAIYTVDLEGLVLSWNSAAERIFGYSSREMVGAPLGRLFDQPEASFQKRLAEIRAGRPAGGLELQARRKDGVRIDVSIWNALVRDSMDSVTAVVEAVADITERRRLEDRFRQAQKMEAVGRLAGGVAHDFNNLLTVITGYCQMILDQVGPSDPIGADMQQVLRAADRATALTRQLLAFSRRQMVQPKVMEADALVHDMGQLLKRVVGESVELHVRTEAPGARIRIDPGNLEQVVTNLAVNARDAMAGGGLLRVETRTVHAGDNSSFPEGEYWLLEVADTGIGMTQEVLSHLFEPFFTTKERGRGTGLGLSTSYGIVKQNRGEILVRSELGKGSIFSIYLPLVTGAVEAVPTECGPSVQYRGSETVLVAEDEHDVRNVITEMLRKQGYTVLPASSGAEALEVASRHRHIDLLITDMVMPGISGKELADELTNSRPDLHVLFVSGYADTGIVHGGVVESDTNFLQKPFAPEELARKVRTVLDARATAATQPVGQTPK